MPCRLDRGSHRGFMKISARFSKKIIPGRRAALLAAVLLLALVVSPACIMFTGSATATPPAQPDFEPLRDALVIEPAALPAARKGDVYAAEIHITKNVTPVGDMLIKTGQLPAGLQFVFLKGKDAAQISGIPEEAGTFTFTLYVWCYGTMVSGQTLEKEYKIVVDE